MSNHPFSLGEEASVAQDLRGASPAAPRRLVALTADDALARSLAELAGAGFDIAVVPDAEALSDELLQSNSSIALIDAGTAGDTVQGLVDALAAQFPDLRLLVAGLGSDQNQLATRISSGRVFRFVHKPASAQRLKLMVDAASRPSDPQRVSVTQTLPILGEAALASAAARGASASRAGGPPQRGTPPWMFIGAAAALALVTVLYLVWPKGADAPPAAATTAASGPAQSAVAGVNDLVRRADQAFADGRYVATDGTSAAELYRDAQKLDPKDTRAADGFERSVEYGMRSAEQALLASNIDEAARTAEMLRLVAPANSRLTFLQSQIDREQARVNQDASTRAAWEARQGQIRAGLERMQLRLGTGLLLEPADDSAMVHFRAAEEAGPGDVAVRNARDGLLAALLDTADRRLDAADASGARRFIEAAASLNSSAPGLDPLRRRLEAITPPASATPATDQASASTVQPAPAPLAELPVAAPAPPPVASVPASTPAPAAAPGDGGPVAATSLKRTRTVDPVYPQRALLDLVSGWVDLEFTVTTEGTVRDIVVTASEPDRVFDSAATNALRRWRFEPVVQDGVAVEVRARQRLRFTARDDRD